MPTTVVTASPRTNSPVAGSPSAKDMWPGVCPGVSTARTPGATSVAIGERLDTVGDGGQAAHRARREGQAFLSDRLDGGGVGPVVDSA